MVLNKALPLIFAAAVLAAHAAPAFAEETKSGSFFSGFRKPKSEPVQPLEKKKPGALEAFFSPKKTLVKKMTDAELTEEEKKMIENAAKITGDVRAPQGPIKLPPPPLNVQPRRSGTQGVSPEMIKPRTNPNTTFRTQIPRAPAKYVNTPVVVRPPKVGGPMKEPSAPNKKQR